MKKSIERVKTSLQIDEDVDLHVTGWTIQRIGWGLMMAIIILSALGFFGNGVVSQRKVAKNGITITYDRFGRYEANTEIEIEASGVQGNIEVRLPGDFTESYKIEYLLPEPSQQRIEEGQIVYNFEATGSGRIAIFVSPREQGGQKGILSVNDTEFNLSSFIYP